MSSITQRLGDVSIITMGTSPKGHTYNEVGEGLPLLNGPTEYGPDHPVCTLYTTDPKRECEPGDLIFCVRGSTTGRMNWADQKYALGRGVCSFRGQSNEDTRFIRYAIEVPFPENRQRIVQTLSAYDDLIENNRRRIELLEKAARLLYKEWFVQLRFPGYEDVSIIDGVPDGWERKTFGEVVNNFDRFRVPLSVFERTNRPGPYPYYGAAGIIGYIDGFLFDGRFLLIGEDGTVATPLGSAMLQFVEGKFWVSNHAHVVQGSSVTTEFLYCFMSKYAIQPHITGVAQPKLSQRNLNRIELLVPSSRVQGLFQDVIAPLIQQVFTLKSQIGELAKARDLLLPRLMNGELAA